MTDEHSNHVWQILQSSVTGSSHIQKHMPNQDAILTRQSPDGLPLVLAIADGHGSERYFRSDIGAQLAVQAAEYALRNFAREIARPAFSFIEADIRKKAQSLSEEIVARWRGLVEQHWQQHQFTEREWQWVVRKENTQDWTSIGTNHTLPYGATLLTVLVTATFILYLQLGDGDILTIYADGSVKEPIPPDQRNIANETTSLCRPTTTHDFRLVLQPLHAPGPAMILVSTDGYSNSFVDRAGFYKLGTDIWDLFRNEGLQQIKENLQGWLQHATTIGSGDDITAGILLRQSALHEVPDPSSRQADPSPPQTDNAIESVAATPAIPVSQDEVPEKSGQKVEELPAEMPGSPQRPLIVSPGSAQPGHYPSISDALSAAQPGAHIQVQPGTYQERLLIDKRVIISGAGQLEDIIIQHEVPCLQMQTWAATVNNITFQGLCKPSSQLDHHAALELHQGQLTLRQCAITSQSDANITIAGKGCHHLIQHCHICDGYGSGIQIIDQGHALIEECEIRNNAGIGIRIIHQGALHMKNTIVSGNKHAEVLLFNCGVLDAEDAFIEHQGREVSVRVKSGSRLHLQNSVIKSAQIGVVLDTMSEGRFTNRTRFKDNKLDIQIKDQDSSLYMENYLIPEYGQIKVAVVGRPIMPDPPSKIGRRYTISKKAGNTLLFVKEEQDNTLSLERPLEHVQDKHAE
jgi:hypothetical protein